MFLQLETKVKLSDGYLAAAVEGCGSLKVMKNVQ